MVFFFFVVSLHLVLYKHYKWLSFILILSVSLFALIYTASRTSFLASILLLLTYIMPTSFMVKIIYNKYLLILVPFLVISPLLFGNWILSNYEELNELLSNRIYIVSLLVELFKSPISFFTGIVIEEEEGIPIDNVFCYMLINYGIIAILVFLCQYVNIIKKRQYISTFVLVPLLIIIISGLGESSWAAFGGMGASFFWILICNQTYERKCN